MGQYESADLARQKPNFYLFRLTFFFDFLRVLTSDCFFLSLRTADLSGACPFLIKRLYPCCLIPPLPYYFRRQFRDFCSLAHFPLFPSVPGSLPFARPSSETSHPFPFFPPEVQFPAFTITVILLFPQSDFCAFFFFSRYKSPFFLTFALWSCLYCFKFIRSWVSFSPPLVGPSNH